MLGWSKSAPVLVEIITDCTRDTTRPSKTFEAKWRDGKQSFLSDDQKLGIRMRVTSCVGLGNDETREIERASGLELTQVGQRKLVLQVQAITTERGDHGSWSMLALERLRTRMCRPRNVAALLEADIAIIDFGPSYKSPFKSDGRMMSASTMDVTLGTVVNDTDPVLADFIAEIVLTTKLEDEGGNPLPEPLNLVDVVLAPNLTT